MTQTTPAAGPIAVVGAGSIGIAFALVFGRGGRDVRVWDALPTAYPRARRELAERAALLGPTHASAVDRITFVDGLDDAVRDAVLVQECAPEKIGVKRDVVARIAAAAPRHAVLASSSSALLPTAIAAELDAAAAERTLVAHPGNPPYLLPVIELVPGTRTAATTVDTAAAVYAAAGLRPIRVKREVGGFVFNRLQGAVLREAYCLVRDGVATVADVDEVVRSGLGRRWSIIGPFETVDLNTRGGIASHAEKMGPAYQAMGAERGQHDPWTPELVAAVTAQRRALLPEAAWGERVRWRDEQLARLAPVWDSIRDGSS